MAMILNFKKTVITKTRKRIAIFKINCNPQVCFRIITGAFNNPFTNVFGDFMFEDVDARGEVVLDVDGSSFKPQAGDTGGARYGTLHKKMTVARGEMNDLRPTRPFFMTPINEKTATFIPADQAVTADINNQISGFKLEVPAGAANFPDGSKEGTITATAVHPQFLPAPVPEGLAPIAYIQLEPDGLWFSEPVPFEIGLDPSFGGTVGAEVALLSYTHEGKYEHLGQGHVVRNAQGELIIRSDPGVGVRTFSGMLFAESWFGSTIHLAFSQRYLYGRVVNGWNGGGVAHVAVTTDFRTYATTDENGFYMLYNPWISYHFSPVRIFAFVPTNYFSTDLEKAADQTTTFYFPFMSEEFDAYGFYLIPAPPVFVRAVFFTGNITYKDRKGGLIPWTDAEENEFSKVVPENAECECPDGNSVCPPSPDYCKTLDQLSAVSKEMSKDVKVQVLMAAPPMEGEGPAPFVDLRASRPPLGPIPPPLDISFDSPYAGRGSYRGTSFAGYNWTLPFRFAPAVDLDDEPVKVRINGAEVTGLFSVSGGGGTVNVDAENYDDLNLSKGWNDLGVEVKLRNGKIIKEQAVFYWSNSIESWFNMEDGATTNWGTLNDIRINFIVASGDTLDFNGTSVSLNGVNVTDSFDFDIAAGLAALREPLTLAPRGNEIVFSAATRDGEGGAVAKLRLDYRPEGRHYENKAAVHSYQAVLMLTRDQFIKYGNIYVVSAFDPHTGQAGYSHFDVNRMVGTSNNFDVRLDLELLPTAVGIDVIRHTPSSEGTRQTLIADGAITGKLKANETISIVVSMLGNVPENSANHLNGWRYITDENDEDTPPDTQLYEILPRRTVIAQLNGSELMPSSDLVAITNEVMGNPDYVDVIVNWYNSLWEDEDATLNGSAAGSSAGRIGQRLAKASIAYIAEEKPLGIIGYCASENNAIINNTKFISFGSRVESDTFMIRKNVSLVFQMIASGPSPDGTKEIQLSTGGYDPVTIKLNKTAAPTGNVTKYSNVRIVSGNCVNDQNNDLYIPISSSTLSPNHPEILGQIEDHGEDDFSSDTNDADVALDVTDGINSDSIKLDLLEFGFEAQNYPECNKTDYDYIQSPVTNLNDLYNGTGKLAYRKYRSQDVDETGSGRECKWYCKRDRRVIDCKPNKVHFTTQKNNWADSVDFVYLSGHGSIGSFGQSTVPPDKLRYRYGSGTGSDDLLRSEIMENNLGESDLDWLILYTCSFLYPEMGVYDDLSNYNSGTSNSSYTITYPPELNINVSPAVLPDIAPDDKVVKFNVTSQQMATLGAKVVLSTDCALQRIRVTPVRMNGNAFQKLEVKLKKGDGVFEHVDIIGDGDDFQIWVDSQSYVGREFSLQIKINQGDNLGNPYLSSIDFFFGPQTDQQKATLLRSLELGSKLRIVLGFNAVQLETIGHFDTYFLPKLKDNSLINAWKLSMPYDGNDYPWAVFYCDNCADDGFYRDHAIKTNNNSTNYIYEGWRYGQ